MTLTGNWNYPTTIWAGPGRLAELARACEVLGIRGPLIVTDKGLAANPMIARARDALGGAVVFSDIKGNPTKSNLDDGITAFKAGNHDGVVAIGGGSALDIGKLIAFQTGQTRPIWDFEDIGDWWTRADTAAIAPIVAVPTTAGTGSEVGRAGVITHDTDHEKKIIFHPKMMPGIVISDPELTVALPPVLTAATGMDAFVHCFEAFCAPGFNPLADGFALQGMRLIKDFLPRAFDAGNDIEARANMLAAASMGAAAFQKGLGAVHALAHPIGARYDTHHGMTNAVLLPYVIQFNRSAIEQRLAPVARLLNVKGGDVDGLLDWILFFRQRLKVPANLRELGVTEDDAPVIGLAAAADPSAGGNPRPVDAKILERLFRAAVRGDLGLAAGCMTLRLLVVEGNTAQVRARQVSLGRRSASAGYAEVLRGLIPDISCTIVYPADTDAPLPTIEELANYDGVVITGSALHAYDTHQPPVARQVDLARTVFASGKPFFGSCWGLQIATVAAGGVVRVNPKGREIGFARNIRLTAAGRTHPLFHGKPEIFKSPAVHLDEVGVLPPHATVLAGNDASAVQAVEIRHDRGIFWGVQYHPEYTMGDVAATIRRYGKILTDEGFFANEAERDTFADDIETLDKAGFDKTVTAQHALDETVLAPDCRRLEIRNWLERQVIPARITG